MAPRGRRRPTSQLRRVSTATPISGAYSLRDAFMSSRILRATPVAAHLRAKVMAWRSVTLRMVPCWDG